MPDRRGRWDRARPPRERAADQRAAIAREILAALSVPGGPGPTLGRVAGGAGSIGEAA